TPAARSNRSSGQPVYPAFAPTCSLCYILRMDRRLSTSTVSERRGAMARRAAEHRGELLPAELTQARRFGKARSAQSTALLEDYVELIADLLATTGEARPTDIARRLGVSHPTAIHAITRLKREALATARPYRGVFLTEKGETLARRGRGRPRLRRGRGAALGGLGGGGAGRARGGGRRWL